jgi:predicted transcriptional regulator
MMEITTQEVEITAEGTLLEVLRVVDVKDSIALVRLRVREWIDERHYRDVDVSGDPVLDFVPEWLAA